MNEFYAGKCQVLYDTINIIHDIIITPYPYPHAAKFVFVGVEINKDQQVRG